MKTLALILNPLLLLVVSILTIAYDDKRDAEFVVNTFFIILFLMMNILALLKPSESEGKFSFLKRLETHYSIAKILFLGFLLLVGLGYIFKIQIKNFFHSQKVHACLEKDHFDACEFVCDYGNESACQHHRKTLARQCFEFNSSFSCMKLCYDFKNKSACDKVDGESD